MAEAAVPAGGRDQAGAGVAGGRLLLGSLHGHHHVHRASRQHQRQLAHHHHRHLVRQRCAAAVVRAELAPRHRQGRRQR